MSESPLQAWTTLDEARNPTWWGTQLATPLPAAAGRATSVQYTHPVKIADLHPNLCAVSVHRTPCQHCTLSTLHPVNIADLHPYSCSAVSVQYTIYIGLTRTKYIHRIWPYIWWFPCQKYRIYTVYIWFWPTLNIHPVKVADLRPTLCAIHTCPNCRTSSGAWAAQKRGKATSRQCGWVQTIAPLATGACAFAYR